MSPLNLAMIAFGGACGAVCRFGAGWVCVRWLGAHASLGTLLVNGIGCLLVGFAMGAGLLPGSVRHSAVVVGFLGSLTTFSAFGLETACFIENRQVGRAVLFVSGNLVAGLAGVLLGLVCGRMLAEG